MDAVRSLEHKITIIMIAHRLSTVKHCDKIFFLEKGKIKAQGTYDELMQQNEIFRSMVEK
jgi:ABC-type multidrug transport system fused ATPase/permease subunit